jgi:hypothetical protein
MSAHPWNRGAVGENMPPDPSMLFVLGASTVTGRAVVAEGLRRGHGVRAFVRSRGLLSPGVDERSGGDAGVTADLLTGVDAVICVIGVMSGRGAIARRPLDEWGASWLVACAADVDAIPPERLALVYRLLWRMLPAARRGPVGAHAGSERIRDLGARHWEVERYSLPGNGDVRAQRRRVAMQVVDAATAPHADQPGIW